MIMLNRLNGVPFFLNPHHIEQMEETPDTIITLDNGKKIIVREKSREVIEKLCTFWRILSNLNLKIDMLLDSAGKTAEIDGKK